MKILTKMTLGIRNLITAFALLICVNVWAKQLDEELIGINFLQHQSILLLPDDFLKYNNQVDLILHKKNQEVYPLVKVEFNSPITSQIIKNHTTDIYFLEIFFSGAFDTGDFMELEFAHNSTIIIHSKLNYYVDIGAKLKIQKQENRLSPYSEKRLSMMLEFTPVVNGLRNIDLLLTYHKSNGYSYRKNFRIPVLVGRNPMEYDKYIQSYIYDKPNVSLLAIDPVSIDANKYNEYISNH